MVERICPQCQHANALENRFCGRCGAPLERHEFAPRQEYALTVFGQNLPMTQIKQVGQTVAVSLAALAAEAGLAWLRRRVDQLKTPTPAIQATPSAAQPTQTAQTALTTGAAVSDVVTVVRQRVVEVWEHGTLTRQTIERTFWRREG